MTHINGKKNKSLTFFILLGIKTDRKYSWVNISLNCFYHVVSFNVKLDPSVGKNLSETEINKEIYVYVRNASIFQYTWKSF